MTGIQCVNETDGNSSYSKDSCKTKTEKVTKDKETVNDAQFKTETETDKELRKKQKQKLLAKI